MLKTGLVSITFRQLSPEKIVDLTAEAKLDSIEWGGDIHVPHGDIKQAELVAELTTGNGLFVSAYGSYYKLGEADSPAIDAVLDTAEALGTKHVRIWAGAKGSKEADDAYRQGVIEDAQRVTDLAKKRDLIISLEHHNNTLTDTTDSTLDLLKAVNSPHFRTYWQPPHIAKAAQKLEGLETLLPYVTNVHVFHWYHDTLSRYPLSRGKEDWAKYADCLRASGNEHVLSLEFVHDDDPNAFFVDARTLRAWLS